MTDDDESREQILQLMHPLCAIAAEGNENSSKQRYREEIDRQ